MGDLGIEGVGFFFNDWITEDDSPRIFRIRRIDLQEDKLLLGVELVSHRTAQVSYDMTNKTVTVSDTAALESTDSPTPSDAVIGSIDPITTIAGYDGTRWVIDHTAKGAPTTELKQFSASGEFLRRLSSPADQPQPVAVAPSTRGERIYLLEESSVVQRLRGLTLIATKTHEGQEPVSDWKVEFEKSIVAHQNFSIAGGKPMVSSHSANPPATIKVRLQPNPLLNDERITAALTAGFDSDGSFLQTTDGLPLCSISDTPNLVRVVLVSHGPNGIDLFQDDGAVVEQFRVTGVDKMMSFDCGSFELK